jgi:hypothetical protein
VRLIKSAVGNMALVGDWPVSRPIAEARKSKFCFAELVNSE